jgi:hypothetical protein
VATEPQRVRPGSQPGEVRPRTEPPGCFHQAPKMPGHTPDIEVFDPTQPPVEGTAGVGRLGGVLRHVVGNGPGPGCCSVWQYSTRQYRARTGMAWSIGCFVFGSVGDDTNIDLVTPSGMVGVPGGEGCCDLGRRCLDGSGQQGRVEQIGRAW